MTLVTPEALWLLPLLALVGGYRVLRPRRHSSLAVADGDAVLAAAARPTWRVRLRWLPTALRLLAVASMIFALARPREGLAVTQRPAEGIDVVVAVDVSSSMTVSGSSRPVVSRLEEAQQVVSSFVETLTGDRVGLVVFQSRALALSPLTHDLEAIQDRIDDLTSGLLADGTAIGLGIAEALSLLEQSPARSRVVVLLTDGENNAGEIEPLDAGRVAGALGVHVYTIGFLSGAAGRSGSIDSQTLRQISQMTGAKFYNARTREELAQAYSDIAELERSRVGDRRFISYREFAPWLLLLTVALLLAEQLSGATWLRRYP